MSAVHQRLPILISDFSGGQVDGEHVTQLQLNQFEHMRNCYAIGKKLRGRPGAMKVSTTGAYSQNLNSVRTYRPITGNWGADTSNLMLGHQTGFAYLNGTTVTTITTALPSSANSWHMRQYKDIMYAAREQTLEADSKIRRVTLSGAGDVGIAPPSAAATAVQGGAGPLEAGAYEYVYTYRNSSTGAESNPSPLVSVTVVANKAVDLSGVTTSANAQVNQRRIYRSIIDSSGIYYYVGDINNNTATTYTDTTSEDDLGDAASYDNDLPPSPIVGIEEFGERLWGWSKNNVYYTRQLFPESWPAENLIPVGVDDNEVIRQCLKDGRAKRLLIGRSRSIYEITGTSERNFRLDLVTAEHGVAGPHSMAAAEGLVFFFSGENFYALPSGGRDPVVISTPAIRKIIDLIPDAQLERVQVATFPRLTWMTAVVAYDGSSTHKLMLVYNYKTGAWAVFSFAAFGAQAPCFVVEATDSNLVPALYAVIESSSYRYVYKFTDDVFTDGAGATDGSVIAVQCRTAGISAQGRMVHIKRVGVLGRFVRNDPPASTYNVGLYSFVEGTIYNVSPKLLPLLAPTDASKASAAAVAQWKQQNLSTAQKLGTFVQVEITCDETANRVEIAALSIEAMVSERVRKVA